MVATNELLLLPLDADLTSFHTSFSIHGKELTFCFHNVPSPADSGKSSLKNTKIQCSSEVRDQLAGFDNVLQQRLSESMDLPTFILELKDILENINFAYSESSLPPAKFYDCLFNEIDAIGWDSLAPVGSDLNQLHFRIFDQAGREHIVEVILPVGYPKVPPMASADLPCIVDFDWQGGDIKSLLQQYGDAIQRYQDFWAVMEDLDNKFWIMEPEHPSRANTFRRIALGGHCSLSLTIDPLSPRSFPECRFFGSDMVISPLRKKLNNNIKKWNVDKFLTENLMEVLEMVPPSQQDTTTHEDMSVGCGICYAFRLSDGDPTNDNFVKEGSIPDRACDNGNCGRPFHTNCLVEWLRSITTTRQSFDVLFGNCPYCSHPIAVKFTSI